MKSTAFLLIGVLLFSTGSYAQNEKRNEQKHYNIEQAISQRAQLHTIAFDGLAFITGNFGADCFFPPGKVADFFGFQYMRDNDSNHLGHNTDFLTRIATNVLHLLTQEQLDQLIVLAKEQEQLYNEFANKRIVLIKAFRESMEQNRPLNKEAVILYCRDMYKLDGMLSYRRAQVTGAVIRSFTPAQLEKFEQLRFGNSGSWPVLEERLDKRSLSHRAHVAVMTYASELFSWYKGSVTADVYFCPERHGTYFGGFYLKDYPAMGNKGYSISTSLTGDAGKSFLDALNSEQRKQIEALPALQQKNLQQIVVLREKIANSLRKFISGNELPDEQQVLHWVEDYGAQDGELSYYYAKAFAAVNSTLTAEQKKNLKDLRNLDIIPRGIYIYSDPEPVPDKIDCSMLFEK